MIAVVLARPTAVLCVAAALVVYAGTYAFWAAA
jgi:hypothetical protein